MAKLTSFEKTRFVMYREEMTDMGIHWAFCRKTGITIIYKVMPRGRFVKLSVAYCNEKDQFKKKIGLITAYDRWQSDMAIQIPTCLGFCSHDMIEQFADLITNGCQSLEWPME